MSTTPTPGQSAMDQCRLDRPALIILDLTLPDGDGFSLVEWLRQQPDLLSLPLVVYSGRDLADAEMTKLRLGPTDFLTKGKVPPSEVEELVLNIVQHLRPVSPARVPRQNNVVGRSAHLPVDPAGTATDLPETVHERMVRYA